MRKLRPRRDWAVPAVRSRTPEAVLTRREQPERVAPQQSGLSSVGRQSWGFGVLGVDDGNDIESAEDAVTGPFHVTEQLIASIDVGTNLLTFVEKFADWVMRRSEAVELVNHAVAVRSVSVDLDLAGLPTSGSQGPRLLDGYLPLPIALLDADGHTTIDVRDETGGRLPRLNRVEERHLLTVGLLHFARSTARRAGHSPFLDEEVIKAIDTIVNDRVWVAGARALQNPELEQGKALLADEAFKAAAEQVAESHFLVALINPEEGRRRVLNYTATEQINTTKRSERRRLERKQSPNAGAHRQIASENKTAAEVDTASKQVGSSDEQAGDGDKESVSWWRSLWRRFSARFLDIGEEDIRFFTPGAGDCVTYHFDLQAPYDLDVCDTRFAARARPPDTNVIRAWDQSGLTTHAHIFVTIKNRITSGDVTTTLRLLPTSVVRSSVISSLFTLASVATGFGLILSRSDHSLAHVIDTSSAVAILLLVPGIVAGALATPSRHSMTTKLLFPTRLTLWASGVASYLVGVAVAAKLKGSPSLAVWAAAAAIAGVSAVRLLEQYLRLLRAPPPETDPAAVQLRGVPMEDEHHVA